MARESVRARLERERAEWRPGMPKPRRSVRMLFASTVLTLQGLAVAFATLTFIGLYRGHEGLPWMIAFGVAVALGCIATCAVLSKPWGLRLGWVMQVLTFAVAVFVPIMLVVAAGFTGCWIYALVKGRQIDEENARRDEAERQLAAGGGEPR
ncbi:DUF4233 domain-containing protein [Falsarthrobacter nasiphocae]|uniref:Fatty acid desaturase n=1 Tax=Falsarthrobacter nasiphocae TaxID=189863 RepID=A0AAE4C767_9MICC|nr:DUF4233 domain-containing protein [Falsarthrobacter nasiphocae]MDR6892927.1 fatty acid desaturase [Falsarthrobacter nasiphocae]